MEPWTTATPACSDLYGGIGIGLGIRIVFKGRASTGGTDLAAQIITKYTGMSLGKSVALIDGVIVMAAAAIQY